MVDSEIVRCALHYVGNNTSDIQNVFYWEYDGTGDLDTDVVDEIEDWLNLEWGPDWGAYASNDFAMLFADLDVMNVDGTVKRNLDTIIVTEVGDETADGMPSPVSGLLTAFTAFPKQRGRKYVPGIADPSILDGLLVAAQVVELLALGTEYVQTITALTNGDLVPGVISRALTDFVIFNGSFIGSDVPAYQRRRKPNVGG